MGITASQDNKYEFVIDIVSGILKYEGIVAWLSAITAKNEQPLTVSKGSLTQHKIYDNQNPFLPAGTGPDSFCKL